MVVFLSIHLKQMKSLFNEPLKPNSKSKIHQTTNATVDGRLREHITACVDPPHLREVSDRVHGAI